MGIEARLRRIDGSGSNWDSVEDLSRRETFNSNMYKKTPQKSHFKVRFGRGAKSESAERGDPIKEDGYDSETNLGEDNYGFDEGHQEGELDHQSSTLEYQILHYSLGPRDKRELIAKLPDENRERVDFVDKYIDIFQDCPSSGRSFSQAEAFALFKDYKEHISNFEPDQIPSSKMGVLLELETMLEEKMEAAKTAGDEKLYQSCEKAFLMVSDLETSEAIEEYYNIAEASQDHGSVIAMRSYIKGLLDREGYCGTEDMRKHKPPIEGGALRLEKNLRILELLRPRTMSPGETTDDGRISTEEDPILADYPIADLAREIERTDFSAEDWRFIEQFSHRGKELHNYIDAFNIAKKDRRNSEEYRKRADEYDKTIEGLRSDEPDEKLPPQVQEMLKREKLTNREIAGRFYEAETSTRIRVEMLRSDGDLPEMIQQALDASGQSRSEYADALETKASELHQKAVDAYNGNITDEQREAANRLPIRREELARRQEHSRDALLNSAKVADAQFRAVKMMMKRKPEDFARQVLLSEIKGMPQVPTDVQEYLFRNYGKNTTALKVMTGKPSSKTFYVDRLIQLRKTVRKDAVYYGKYAHYQESKYGIAVGYDVETGTVEEEPSYAMRKDESFINEEVLPALDRIIEKIGGEVPLDNEERKARGLLIEREEQKNPTEIATEEQVESDEEISNGERAVA